MSGITGGVWTAEGEPLSAEVLERMLAALTHRGPDGQGVYCREVRFGVAHVPVPGVALGQRWRRDTDEQTSPAANEDGTVHAVLDGTLDNRLLLRRRLEGAGHRFATEGQSEILVHLYEDEGPDCFTFLEGPFAAAIWDASGRRLVMARDRLGQKPLVYRAERDRLLFASELTGLLEVPGVPREVDPAAVDEYLTYGYVPHSHTMLRGLSKLPPAYCAVYRDGQLSFRPYWQADFDSEDSRPVAELRRELRERLVASVTSQMAAQEGTGVWLSGGVDSAVLAALIQQSSDRPVGTFCLKTPWTGHDESPVAEAIAGQLGTWHHTIPCTVDLGEKVDALAGRFDEPLADPTVVLQSVLAQVTREHAPCVLTGLGADELFAGYPHYVAVRSWFDRLPGWVRAGMASPAQKREADEAQLRRKPLAKPRGRRYLDHVAIFDEAGRGEVYHEDFLPRLPNADPFDFLRAALGQVRGRDPLSSVTLADLQTALPCQLLAGLDAATTPHGLSCRQPFLDSKLVDLAVGIPARWKWRRGRGKRILREAGADLVPGSILGKPHCSWRPPVAAWLRNELRQFGAEVLLDPATLGRGYFRPAALRGMWEEHQSGGTDYGRRLWALLMFELWHRRWVR